MSKKRTDSLATQTNDEHKVFATAEEQILHRPGQWIGSRKSIDVQQYVYVDGGFKLQTGTMNQGLAKIIEEIIINSADEHNRTSEDPKKRGWVLNRIDVSVTTDGHVTVRDNGGIDTGFHSTGPRILEVIFGSLFSSSNYDDTKDRKTVGTNGVGGSLANLFSKRFKVTTADGKNVLSIEWLDNKSTQNDPVIKPVKSSDIASHYTLIEYEIDLHRFRVDAIPDGVMQHLQRLCMVLAATNPGLTVSFNSEVFKFDNFSQYVALYGDKQFVVDDNEKWQLYITPTYGLTDPRIIGIVNGAECHKGTHIQMAKKVVNRALSEYLSKININDLSSNKLASSYNVYVAINVDKPEYTAQNKDELANDLYEIRDDRKRSFSLSSTFIRQLTESDVVKYLVQLAKAESEARNSSELKKAVKALKSVRPQSITKLIDASETSSTIRKNEAELWIFEGDSAGSNFRSTRLPRLQASYCLRGKMRNTSRMSTLQILKNKEIEDLVVSIGLDPREPSDLSKIRYNKIIFCTDMDYDGYSIFALGFTMFATHFPKMIEEGHIYRAISPLWKAVKGSDVKYFLNNEEYEQWANTHNTKGYEISYFKGLGSLEKQDYKMMLREHTFLEQLTLDDDTLEKIDIFMRKDSDTRDDLKDVLRSN